MVSKNVNFGPANPGLPYTASFRPGVQVMGGRMGEGNGRRGRKGVGDGRKGVGRRETNGERGRKDEGRRKG